MSFKDVPLSPAVSFKNASLVGADLSSKNLSNMDFTNANLANSNLTGRFFPSLKYVDLFL